MRPIDKLKKSDKAVTVLSTDYLRFAFALAVVLGLIMLCAWLVRRFRIGSFAGHIGQSERLQLMETLSIGSQQRLVLVRRDDREHLLLLGPEKGTLIESGIHQRITTESLLTTVRAGHES